MIISAPYATRAYVGSTRHPVPQPLPPLTTAKGMNLEQAMEPVSRNRVPRGLDDVIAEVSVTGPWSIDVHGALQDPGMLGPFRVKAGGFDAALAAAQVFSREDRASIAVVEQPKTGQRFLVPLAIAPDRLELAPRSFAQVGGEPHFTSKEEFVLVRGAHELEKLGLDVEAVVSDRGRSFTNLTGYPLTLDVTRHRN